MADERIGLHSLKAPAGGRRPRKRIGRGQGSGFGKTAGRRQRGTGMITTIANAFSVPEIRKKIFFTLMVLALYRLGAHIPAPGVNADAVKSLNDQFAGGNILGFLSLFSGSALQNFAIFSLGIMPYITASIILQLLTVAVPSLEKLQKEGEVGQQKITQYTRYLTVALAAGQAIGFTFLFRTIGRQNGASVFGNLTFGKLFMV